ncbi:MAG: exodeoxyribonuclease VII small subunit [Azospirillaceae bacterium]
MTTSPPSDIAKMTFEQALAELEEIVRQLEQGEMDLDKSISAYERGAQLKSHCEAKLREAQMKVEKITVGPNGDVSAEPTDLS